MTMVVGVTVHLHLWEHKFTMYVYHQQLTYVIVRACRVACSTGAQWMW